MRIFAAIYKLSSFRRLSADGHSPMGGGFSSRFAADASAPSYGLVTTPLLWYRPVGDGFCPEEELHETTYIQI